MNKPIICIDFDGVIHSYDQGWQRGEIYGHIVPGFLAWAVAAAQRFDLVIYSSRSKTPEGIESMRAWLRKRLIERMMPTDAESFIELFSFAHEKPPAFLTIDDRAIQFRGDWTAPEFTPDAIAIFKPWNSK